MHRCVEVRLTLGIALLASASAWGATTGSPPAGSNGVENAGATVVEAEALVITATRLPRPLSATPASITVIDEATIRSSAAQNPDDLLRTLSGVNVVRSYGMGYGIPGQINIRGVPGLHGTLLMADGFPLNEAATGFLGLNEIPDSALRKIELVRGPFSALYGPDAFAGVVQLLTLEAQGPPLAEAAARLGNEDFREAWANVRASTGGVGCVLSVDARQIDNYLAHDRIQERGIDPATGQAVDVSRAAENYDYDDVRVLGKAGGAVGMGSHLTFIGRLFAGHQGYGQADYRPAYPVAVDNESETFTGMLGATVDTEWSARTRTTLTGSYRQQEREQWGLQPTVDPTGLPTLARSYSRTRAQEWRGEGLAQLEAGAHVLTPGIDASTVLADFDPTRDAGSGRALPPSAGRDVDDDHVGIYLQDEAPLTERLRWAGGLRADGHSGFDAVVSPRGGLVYEAAVGTKLHASLGRAYRAPSLLERYQPDVAFGNQVFQANPDLEPEYVLASDAGLEQRVGDACTLRLGGFYNDMEDLIATRQAGSVVSFENVDDARSAGIETGIDCELTRGVSAFVNYTWQQTEDRATGRDLAYMPKDAAGIGLRVERLVRGVGIAGSVTEQYVGRRGYVDEATGQWQSLDGYWRTDAALKGSAGERGWAGVGVQNLTDERYQESSAVNPAPGRLWYVEAGVKL